MALEPVDILITDGSAANRPVEGVVVRIYDDRGIAFVTEAVTSAAGIASLLLPSPELFQARFYKFQASIRQPQFIQVLEAPAVNRFEVTAHLFARPAALDSRLCRCSGHFRNPDGSALRGLHLQVTPRFNALVLDHAAVLTDRMDCRTDRDGYVELDLIRFAQYEVSVAGPEGSTRVVHVPDSASANLPDLLFPVVSDVVLEPKGPYFVEQGARNELVIIPQVYASDGRQLVGAALEDVQWTTGDESIAVAIPSASAVTIRGLGSGSTVLLASRRNTSIVRIPNTPISGVPVSITVA